MTLPLLREQRAAARRTLSAEVFAYYAAGSGDEVTLREARRSWQRYRLRPHVLRDVSAPDTTTTLLHTPLAAPIVVAPLAFQALAHPHGEAATARGAGEAGSLLVLSTRSSTRLEDVGAAAAGPWWFQVYVLRERELTAALVRRAAKAGASALVLTVDAPYVPPKRRVPRVPVDDDTYLVNLAEHRATALPDLADTAQDPGVTFDVVGWLRELSGLPVLVKGVLRPDDALGALAAGAAGVVVSAHGGRQLDRALATAAALPAVVDAVGPSGEVYVDGGIRSGADILTALALGARAVLVGRPVLWALAASGEAGVGALLRTLRDDLAAAMALAGVRSLADIGRDLLCPLGDDRPDTIGRSSGCGA